MNHIAVLGPRGQLGSMLVALGGTPIHADITHTDSLRVALRGYDAVINCAAYTHVDAAEGNPSTAMLVNAVGPLLLTRVFPGYIIHLSTDYVFDGVWGPYTEPDKPNPYSIYGCSKLAGEIAIRLRPDALIVRTTVLFRAGHKNFVTSILANLEEHGEVSVTTSLIGTPTYVPDLAERLMLLARRMPGTNGVLHLAGSRLLSRYEFAIEIAKIWGYDSERIKPTPKVIGVAPRPRQAGLISQRVGSFLKFEAPHDPFRGLEEMRHGSNRA